MAGLDRKLLEFFKMLSQQLVVRFLKVVIHLSDQLSPSFEFYLRNMPDAGCNFGKSHSQFAGTSNSFNDFRIFSVKFFKVTHP